eukprot:5830748-Alexandrium_andersonii.AAC.1
MGGSSRAERRKTQFRLRALAEEPAPPSIPGLGQSWFIVMGWRALRRELRSVGQMSPLFEGAGEGRWGMARAVRPE